MMMREKVGFIENTAMRHRRGGGGEVTVTSRLTDKKTKKYKRECRWTVGGGSMIRSQVERLKYLGARLGAADCLFQKPARPG